MKDHPLFLRMTMLRSSMREAGRKLRRARRLYISLCEAAIMKDLSGGTLNMAAHRMVDVQLYAQPVSLRHVRFSILRSIWRKQGGVYGGFGWHIWLRENNWDCDFNKRSEAA